MPTLWILPYPVCVVLCISITISIWSMIKMGKDLKPVKNPWSIKWDLPLCDQVAWLRQEPSRQVYITVIELPCMHNVSMWFLERVEHSKDVETEVPKMSRHSSSDHHTQERVCLGKHNNSANISHLHVVHSKGSGGPWAGQAGKRNAPAQDGQLHLTQANIIQMEKHKRIGAGESWAGCWFSMMVFRGFL